MQLEILISTMHESNYDLLEKINLQTNAVVVNQCDRDDIVELSFKDKKVVWVNTTERGLSNSRNMAIKYASGDVCLIVDNDEIMFDNYEHIILQEFENNKKADIISFNVSGIEKVFKNYNKNKFKHNFLTSMRCSSVEVAFKLDFVKRNKICFDNQIGAGTKLLFGEENKFLIECLRKKAKFYYVPVCIAYLHIGKSTWFTGYNENYFLAQGAVYESFNTHFTLALIYIFAFRHKSLFSEEIPLTKGIKLMKKGRKLYIHNK